MNGLALILAAEYARKTPKRVKAALGARSKAVELMQSNPRPVFNTPELPKKYTINLKKSNEN